MKWPTASGSLQQNLLRWALGALAVVWLSFVVVGFRTGLHEADELTDGHLASVAALIATFEDAAHDGRLQLENTLPEDLKRHDYQQSFSAFVWDDGDRLRVRIGDAPLPPELPPEGFAELRLGEPPARWRAFTRRDGLRRISVLLEVEERDALARDIAEQLAEPGFWLLPVVALVLGLAIRRGLRPLHALSADVHALDAASATGLRAAHPEVEFAAVVEAINRLLERQQETLQRERDLASELAHELRTPLAALALQARALRGEAPGAARDAALARLEAEALRAGEVLTQLLSLARAQRTQLAETAQRFDLAELTRRVVADYAQAALDRGHELSVAGSEAFELEGHPLLVELALRNLVDNALGHTPPGTAVEVRVDADGRWLQVADNGAALGAAPAPRPAPAPSPSPPGDGVPAGPGRPLGLGLGHRVVAKIAAMHGAAFAAVAPPPGHTACYRLSFQAR